MPDHGNFHETVILKSQILVKDAKLFAHTKMSKIFHVTGNSWCLIPKELSFICSIFKDLGNILPTWQIHSSAIAVQYPK